MIDYTRPSVVGLHTDQSSYIVYNYLKRCGFRDRRNIVYNFNLKCRRLCREGEDGIKMDLREIGWGGGCGVDSPGSG
jgi:hypothetical protein